MMRNRLYHDYLLNQQDGLLIFFLLLVAIRSYTQILISSNWFIYTKIGIIFLLGFLLYLQAMI